MKHYKEDEYLQIAGIQHFSFCRRQWALIHIEQQWAENVLTVGGNIVHEHAHDASFCEKRGNVLITRGLEIHQNELGIYGVCDVVEFHKDEEGCSLRNYEGKWKPCAVEYKRGKPKITNADRLQLCAQTICLETMFDVSIMKGYLYYDEIKHRESVEIGDDLRKECVQMIEQMHSLYDSKRTPKGKAEKHCYACSLRNLCIPTLNESMNVEDYILSHIKE